MENIELRAALDQVTRERDGLKESIKIIENERDSYKQNSSTLEVKNINYKQTVEELTFQINRLQQTVELLRQKISKENIKQNSYNSIESNPIITEPFSIETTTLQSPSNETHSPYSNNRKLSIPINEMNIQYNNSRKLSVQSSYENNMQGSEQRKFSNESNTSTSPNEYSKKATQYKSNQSNTPTSPNGNKSNELTNSLSIKEQSNQLMKLNTQNSNNSASFSQSDLLQSSEQLVERDNKNTPIERSTTIKSTHFEDQRFDKPNAFSSNPSLEEILSVESEATSLVDILKSSRRSETSFLPRNPIDYDIFSINSNFNHSKKPHDQFSFIFSIRNVSNNKELWRIEKDYSKFIELDLGIKHPSNQSIINSIGKPTLIAINFIGKLPLLLSFLESYLRRLKDVLHHRVAFNTFLNSDKIIIQNTDLEHKKMTSCMEGYLFKKGKNLSGWKMRYFILKHAVLESFDHKNGILNGSLKLKYCTVAALPGKDLSTTYFLDSVADEIRHGIIITEYKKSAFKNGQLLESAIESKNAAKYVLCSENDIERDLWISFMDAHIRKIKTLFEAALSATNAETFFNSNSNPELDEQENINNTNINNINNSKLDDSKRIKEENGIKLRDPKIQIVRDVYSAFNPTSVSSVYSQFNPLSIYNPISNDDINTDSPTKLLPQLPSNSNLDHRNIIDDHLIILSKPPPPPLATVLTSAESKFSKEESKNRSRFTMFKKKPINPEVPGRKIFGIPCEKAVQLSKIVDDLELPAIMYRCIEYLNHRHAEKEEGIYRLSGSSVTIQNLKERFNNEYDVNLILNDPFDIHAVSGLLKLFLRELPETLLTSELHRKFMKVNELPTRNKKIIELSRLVILLPLSNYTILRTLAIHLIHVVYNSNVNKMTARNISIVFSPTLNVPAPILMLMMSEFEHIFDGEPVMDDESNQETIHQENPIIEETFHNDKPLIEETINHDIIIRGEPTRSVAASRSNIDQDMSLQKISSFNFDVFANSLNHPKTPNETTPFSSHTGNSNNTSSSHFVVSKSSLGGEITVPNSIQDSPVSDETEIVVVE